MRQFSCLGLLGSVLLLLALLWMLKMVATSKGALDDPDYRCGFRIDTLDIECGYNVELVR
jgi:hypothetical protein